MYRRPENISHDCELYLYILAIPQKVRPWLLSMPRSGLKYIPDIYIDAKTRDWLWEETGLAVSSVFLHRIYFSQRGATAHVGNASFSKRGGDGRISCQCSFYCCYVPGQLFDFVPLSIDGFYPFRSGFTSMQSHLWFTHDLDSNCSTYMITICPEHTKTRILDLVFSGRSSRLQEPLIVDAIIANDYSTMWAQDIMAARNELISVVECILYEGVVLQLRHVYSRKNSGFQESPT